jgi:hypothetical protein
MRPRGEIEDAVVHKEVAVVHEEVEDAMVGDEVAVWQRYATELELVFGDSPSRIRAVRTAYVHGFDVELIAELSGFPVWRVRQAILSV